MKHSHEFKRASMLFLMSFLTPLYLLAQAPPIQWQATFGSTSYDDLVSLQKTMDGGYILGGISASDQSGDKSENSKGSSDYWIVKIDASGKKVWDKTLGGNNQEALKALKPTADGGYLLGGESYSDASGDKSEKLNQLGFDLWVVKVDASGNKVWDKSLQGGGSGNEYNELTCLSLTRDGGYIIGGRRTIYSNNGTIINYLIIKLNANGDKVWEKSFGGVGSIGSLATGNFLTAVDQTFDGGFILGGTSDSFQGGDKSENSKGNYDYWVIKLDANGTRIWDKTIGGTANDNLYSLQQTADGGFILGGNSMSDISGDKTENAKSILRDFWFGDYWVVKLDALGNKVWDKTFGTEEYQQLASVRQTNDGGFIVGGYSSAGISGDKTENSRGLGAFDAWIIKTDAFGNLEWDKTIGGNSMDYLTSLEPTSDNGYILGIHSSSEEISGDKSIANKGQTDYWVVKLGADVIEGKKVLICHKGKEISVDANAVSAHLKHGDSLGQCGTNTLAKTTDELPSKMKIYPNPAGSFIDLEWTPKADQENIRIVNLYGKTVKNVTPEMNAVGSLYKQRISLSGLDKGTYFLIISSKVEKQIGEFVLQ